MNVTSHPAGLWERGSQLAELDTLIEASSAGSGQVAVIAGPAGIGKTRLLAEGRLSAGKAGFLVLSGRGSELERTFAYGLVRQLYEQLLHNADPPRRADWLSGAAAQAEPIFSLGQSSSASADFALIHGLYWLTANLAQDRPLMLAIDDLPLVDAASMRYLAYLLPRLDGIRLLLLLAARVGENDNAKESDLLEIVIGDPENVTLRLAPLTADATAGLLAASFPADRVDDKFVAACHTATGGNPLLLHELVNVLTAQRLAPIESNVPRVLELGPKALIRQVTSRLRRLPTGPGALARAVAVLGDNARLSDAARLAGLDASTAMRAAEVLWRADLLSMSRTPDRNADMRLSYVHPLVRAAVYETLPPYERDAAHAAAADILAAAGPDYERAAAHLLNTPRTGGPAQATILHHAATAALARGAPDMACTYLRRYLAEPLADPERLAALVELGAAARDVDATLSAETLRTALELKQEPASRSMIADLLAEALMVLNRTDEAVEVLSDALDGSGSQGADVIYRLESQLINVASRDPRLNRILAEHVQKLMNVSPGPHVGGRMLDCMLMAHYVRSGSRRATVIDRTRRGLGDHVLIEQANGSDPFIIGCYSLIAADDWSVLEVLDSSVTAAHQRGSTYALAGTKGARAWAWFLRGFLAEGAADARDAMRAIETTNMHYDRALVAPVLANILMEQGKLAEAAKALEWPGRVQDLPFAGSWYHLELGHSRLLFLQRRWDDALKQALAAGRRYSDTGNQNPAFLPWRGQAALCLHALGRLAESRAYAAKDLAAARRWGAPRALGLALRIAARVDDGADRFSLLREAVEVLQDTPVRLEYAKALVDLGSALRRSNARSAARPHLAKGLDLAHQCAAQLLIERAGAELRAAGARPRVPSMIGLESLTPSERRVADLAAGDITNREIAQQLFVTVKTVEVHLSAVYRKLGVTRRKELTAKLGSG